MHVLSLTPSCVPHAQRTTASWPLAFSLLRRELTRQLAETELNIPNKPAIHSRETEDALILNVALPGVTVEGLEITGKEQELTIRAKRTVDVPEGYRALHRERSSLEFQQTLELPASVDASQAAAQLIQGQLTLTLPKKAASKPQRINVTSGPPGATVTP